MLGADSDRETVLGKAGEKRRVVLSPIHGSAYITTRVVIVEAVSSLHVRFIIPHRRFCIKK